MRSVQVYVEGQRLELFKDEQITIQSEQQNIKDIQSVKTDYSQTFTIPTTPNNNKIFKHFLRVIYRRKCRPQHQKVSAYRNRLNTIQKR